MKKIILTAALAALATPALAHPGHEHTSGFMAGITHPLALDHLLAMVCVGLWSGFVLPGRVWAGAAAFLAAMAAGAGLSWAGVGFPMVEGWITLSVLVFGLITIFSRPGQPDWMTGATLAVIALFASAHGHAHATEATGDAAGYLTGFLIATALLHLAGIAMARGILSGQAARSMQRLSGAVVALGGLWLMVG
ncbi:MAG: HupE/UreJ family protein [Paracoccus sp. (in: a-proteobacteria)]|nr:HupE/UreJ family protein [Paracoccus sp. (in: a-proteobacteria)]